MARPLRLSRSDLAIVAAVCAVFLSGVLGHRAGIIDGQNAILAPLGRFVVEDGTELQALATRYGPARNSQNAEEWIIRDFFQDERDGVFVDVGANHHQRFSNTYYLETELGWSGVAIEPQADFAPGYAEFRPRTTFVPLFVSDVSDTNATLHVTGNTLVASRSRDFTEAFGGTAREVITTTTTLDAVLDSLQVATFDLLSMDIELAEPQALAGFSIERFRPRLVGIEAHPSVRQEILGYFARHDYVLLGKYWRADDENFWFAPLD